MIPLLAAALLLHAQDKPVLPVPTPAVVPNEVRDWPGFKYLPAGPRTVPATFLSPGDWSSLKAETAPNAAVWRTKVVVLTRVDRVYDGGKDVLGSGHHAFAPFQVARIRRALGGLHALAAHLSNGAINMTFDVTEENELLVVQGGDLGDVVRNYLHPRINDGRYEAEDGVFRGPYQSVIVLHPLGGEAVAPFEVQSAPVATVGLPDVRSQEVDGGLAVALAFSWVDAVARRASNAGLTSFASSDGHIIGALDSPLMYVPAGDWSPILAGKDAPTEARLRLAAIPLLQGRSALLPPLLIPAERGVETTAKIEKDSVRGDVLTVEESGAIRAGGIALPTTGDVAIPDTNLKPTFAFWAKSDARDSVVIQFDEKAIRLGTDVPFVYDGTWRRVKVDLRPLKPVRRILIAPDEAARGRIRNTLGPIVASFSDFEITDDAPDPNPTPEPPSPTALTAEARAAWAAAAEPGDARRLLMKDPVDAVRANAVAAALARPDAGDEPVLIESALFTFEPTIFTPALRALGKLKTPTAGEAVRRALRSAASERARGLAAEILTEGGDPKFVPLLIGLNQARSRSARISAIRSLGRIPGSESGLMRMAFLSQDDPEVKLETTLTADANDDYQGRKLLWSAVNEPSDAVRLESLRRLSYSTVKTFRDEGMKGVRDDSVGLRVGLLKAWTTAPRAEFVPAIRVAIADRSPRVRAAALDALGASGVVEAKDVPFEDADPNVQLAILRLARTKGLMVPAETRERFRKSPDPRVRNGATTLDG